MNQAQRDGLIDQCLTECGQVLGYLDGQALTGHWKSLHRAVTELHMAVEMMRFRPVCAHQSDPGDEQ